jgi:hypothetical protein
MQVTREQECRRALEGHTQFLVDTMRLIKEWHAQGELRSVYELMKVDMASVGRLDLWESLNPLPGWENDARSLARQAASCGLMFVGRDGANPVFNGEKS